MSAVPPLLILLLCQCVRDGQTTNPIIKGLSISVCLRKFHKGENPQQFCKITILQTANTIKEIKKLEIMWTRKLFSYKPTGLNVREEHDDDN